MVPRIGEVVERLVDGKWEPDWVRQVRDGDRLFVLMWGEYREEFEEGDVWRDRILKEMPPISKYTIPQSLWIDEPKKRPKKKSLEGANAHGSW